MTTRRTRTAALIGAVAVAISTLLTAAPAGALTFDSRPVRETLHVTVAGAHYTLHDRSYGTATRTLHIGGTTGTVPAHYRLTFTDGGGHVLTVAKRGLEKQAYVIETFTDRSFATRRAFRAAEHRALTVSSAVADARQRKHLRILSVQSDLEATITASSDYVDTVPAGTTPDFRSVTTVKSNEYRGTATVSGNDATSWTVTVRDVQDGYGMVYDHATGSEGVFRF